MKARVKAIETNSFNPVFMVDVEKLIVNDRLMPELPFIEIEPDK